MPVDTRAARPRRYLMCRPDFFEVTYAINPWMDPSEPVDTQLAVTQWERLHGALVEAGHTVELIDPVPGLPDMVYAANGATVVDGKVLGARFRNEERAAEGAAYLNWFRDNGFTDTLEPDHLNEGEGDLLTTRSYILAGHGFRSSAAGHREAEAYFGRPVISLELVDPRFYHLDTALAVLDGDEIMYNPSAFSAASRATLERLFPDAILATDDDAAAFGLNALSDGRNVFLSRTASSLAARLREHGFTPRLIDLSELFKGGGSVKCCTLELRSAA
ncbi:dimethylargininase [Streptacidiphilus jiangxiensis]|uniref:N-Dimethylarginine dimethylaminohydrolase n=1 Tax=Streptacidiphilus jiangxiensis TaxID=235985 RepID=A0A1H7REC8_STRJI|nr:N-Dimethylarginine dimethylaminohydrolase [Streptacidiphilus jiangxiensis]